MDKMVKEQKKLSSSESPVLTVKSLIEKMGIMDREVAF